MDMTQTRSSQRYQRLLTHAKSLPPMATAVVHPCDEASIGGVLEAAKLGLISPVLVGPPARIKAVAKGAGLDISAFGLVGSEHSHDSAAKAVELVRQAKV